MGGSHGCHQDLVMKTVAPGLLIMVWSCDLQKPELAATPFMVAQAAAALDLQVEMLFTAQAVQWLFLEHRDRLIGFGPQRLSVRHYLEAAADVGIEIRACSQAMHALGCRSDTLAPQCAGLGGIVAFIERGQDPAWRALVF
jgi:predicted peroxiredoxin